MLRPHAAQGSRDLLKMMLDKVRQPLLTLTLISCHPTTVNDVQEIRALVNGLLADLALNHAILIAAPAEWTNEWSHSQCDDVFIVFRESVRLVQESCVANQPSPRAL
jgi:hypothetical protein